MRSRLNLNQSGTPPIQNLHPRLDAPPSRGVTLLHERILHSSERRTISSHALVLVSEGQPIQELVPRHLAETPAAFGIMVKL